MKILIIDDDTSIVELVKRPTAESFLVESAADGEQWSLWLALAPTV